VAVLLRIDWFAGLTFTVLDRNLISRLSHGVQCRYLPDLYILHCLANINIDTLWYIFYSK